MLNGVFAVNKPSGPTSQEIVSKLKHIFSRKPYFTPERKKKFIKIGHGGTLDPLASGVLVIGVGSGTKQLGEFLGQCTKVYKATAVVGVSTTTYDSEGEVCSIGKSEITQSELDAVLPQFKGEITQTPPIYSALKMDGKPLYEYARENIPLPREIPSRRCEILEIAGVVKPAIERSEDVGESTSKRSDPASSLRLDVGSKGESTNDETTDEPTNDPSKDPSDPSDPSDPNSKDSSGASAVGEEVSTSTVGDSGTVDSLHSGTVDTPENSGVSDSHDAPSLRSGTVDTPENSGVSDSLRSSIELTFSVSSGTYIRSLIHDIGIALGTYAHMTRLERVRQGQYELGMNVLEMNTFDGEFDSILKQALSAGPNFKAPTTTTE